MAASPAPEISVVVPTRDRPAALGRCLRALAAQTVPIEVVVVDDGSTDRRGVEAAVAASPAEAAIVRTPGAGPAGARNAGIEATGGAVVCFTDDDCEPAPKWAAALAAAALAAPGGAAAGRLLPPPDAGPAALASQAVIDALQLGRGRRAGEALRFAPTSSLACTRALLAAVRFDESFPLAAGEDRAFSDRLAAADSSPLYAPEAALVHRLDDGVAALLRRQFRYGRGAVHYGRRAEAPRARAGADFYRGLLGAAARRGPRVLALALLGQAAVAAGAARALLGRG